MSRCEFYVNDSYDMYENAVLYDEYGNTINLNYYVHTSILQDSVLVVERNNRKEIWFRYFPYGPYGDGYKLTVYGQEVDELIIFNHTGGVLTVDQIEVKPGETMSIYK